MQEITPLASSDFKLQMAILTERFGKTHYSDRVIALIYSAVKCLHVNDWNGIVNSILENRRQAPTVSEIREYVRIRKQVAYTGSDIEKDINGFTPEEAIEFKRQQDRLIVLKADFKKTFPVEEGEPENKRLLDYLKLWFAGVYGKQAMYDLTKHGLTLELFAYPALDDLALSLNKPMKAIERGKRIVQSL